MKKEDFERYYQAYNAEGAEGVAGFYTDDAVFEFGESRYSGRDAILAYFKGLHRAFKETMRPTNILVDGNRAAVELESDFEAKIPLKDFMGKSLDVGQSATAGFAAFYETEGTRISRVRIYRS